jgi:hypothetical protein
MATNPYQRIPDDDDSPSFDLAVAAVMWIGAVCLVVAVNYGAEHGVNEHMRGLIVLMHQYYGKWLIAGVAALAGLGMCVSAVRRMNAVTRPPEFLPGMVVLESMRWFRQGPPKSRRGSA